MFTNFANQTEEEKTIWSMGVWKQARDRSFTAKFEGTEATNMIQRITELKQTEKGARAVITLIHDLEGDGVAGDRTLEGNEEAMTSSDQVIDVDQLRHAVLHEGAMANQRSVVNFRLQSRDKLAYWLANRWDQMAFLHLSGISYAYTTRGALRGTTAQNPLSSQLQLLKFAADAAKPLTANRQFQWDATNGLLRAGQAGFGNANIVAADTPTYEMVLAAKTAAENSYLQPIYSKGGIEHFNMFMTPDGIKALKMDPDFKAAYKDALPRSADNPLFKGTDVIWLDGIAIYPHKMTFNNRNAPAGSKWGAGGAVDGQRIIVAGAQALAKADIGRPKWVEKEFDFENKPGISAGKMCGLLRPQFKGVDSGLLEDFGSFVIDTAL